MAASRSRRTSCAAAFCTTRAFLPSHSGYENFAHAEMLPCELESTSGMRARGVDAQNEPRIVSWLDETAENGGEPAAELP